MSGEKETNGYWYSARNLSAGGGIILAALSLYMMFNFMATAQTETNKVLRDLMFAVQENTQATASLNQFIRDNQRTNIQTYTPSTR